MLCVRPEPASAALVRERIAADLTADHVTRDSVADVVLVASELVGNAVVHAAQPQDLDVTWEFENGWVVVCVGDGSDQQPRPRNAAPDAGNGRGLAIVAAVAEEWGVHRLARGKQVWARVPVCRAS
jgi:two-component sensor histidine kinase